MSVYGIVNNVNDFSICFLLEMQLNPNSEKKEVSLWIPNRFV